PRLVVDFHEAENHLGFSTRPVDFAGVRQVRASSFSDETRDATRVVFDLEEGVSYSVRREEEGGVTVRFEGARSVVESRTAAAPTAAPVPPSGPVMGVGSGIELPALGAGRTAQAIQAF